MARVSRVFLDYLIYKLNDSLSLLLNLAVMDQLFRIEWLALPVLGVQHGKRK